MLLARLARVLLGACALATASQMSLIFWGTPVPFTLGPQAALMIAALLGPGEGVAAVLTWLAVGLLGAPVFASHLTGPAALMGPSAGYILGYLPAAALVGRFGRAHGYLGLMAWLGATCVILASGALGLARLLDVGALWHVAVAPFWVTDCCKATLAYWVVRGASALRAKLR